MVISSQENKEEKNINWDKLAQINNDIVGWIEIPNTNINYPILKDENLFYTNHDFEKNKSKSGCIFVRNEKLLENEETTIYGHNMKNGTMFSELDGYIKKDFFKNNSKIFIYTKESTYEGTIFSAYSKGINEETNDSKNMNFQQKIQYYKSQSSQESQIDCKINKIVKLVTCSYINATTTPTDQRYFIIAQIK